MNWARAIDDLSDAFDLTIYNSDGSINRSVNDPDRGSSIYPNFFAANFATNAAATSLFTIPGSIDISVLSGAFDLTDAYIFGTIGTVPGDFSGLGAQTGLLSLTLIPGTPTSVPEPTTLLLLTPGLIGAALARRRRAQAARR